MQVVITRKNGNLSESLKNYIDKTVSELSRHFANIIDAHVTIDLEGRENTVEITLRVARRTLVSRFQSSNLRAAIDGCVDKLDKQLDKVKGKYRKKARKAEQAGSVLPDEAAELEFEEEGLPLLTIEREELILETEERTGTGN